jgi:hypothetical protein
MGGSMLAVHPQQNVIKPAFHKALPFSDLARGGPEFQQIVQFFSHKVLTRVGSGRYSSPPQQTTQRRKRNAATCTAL